MEFYQIVAVLFFAFGGLFSGLCIFFEGLDAKKGQINKADRGSLRLMNRQTVKEALQGNRRPSEANAANNPRFAS